MASVQELQNQIYQLKQELEAARKEQPPEKIEKTYQLQTPQGPKSLSDLFGDKDELILIHNMGASCNFCTMWADTLQSSLPYIKSRAAIALVSPDSPENQTKLAEHRRWDFPMLQDADMEFTKDMGYYASEGEWTGFLPGTSTFKKLEDGSIVRTGHTPFGPMDDFNPVWHFWSLLDGNTTEWHPEPTMFTS